MSKVRQAIDMAKLAWLTLSPWQQLRTATRGAQAVVYIALGFLIASQIVQQAGEMYIVPLGWALWFLIAWFTIGGIFMVAKTPAVCLAAILGLQGRPSIPQSVLWDLEWLGGRTVLSLPFVLGGLGVPIVFGVINLFIISASTGGLSQAEAAGLVAPTAVLVVIVAVVQIFHILMSLTPVKSWIERDIERLQELGAFPEPGDFEDEAVTPLTMAGIFTIFAMLAIGGSFHV